MPRIIMHPAVILLIGVLIGTKWGASIPGVNKVA